MGVIAFQRAVKFFIAKRTVESYSKLTGKKFKIADNLTGNVGWCDFLGEEEWGECTDAFQSGEEAKHLLQNLFSLDVEALEKEYLIRIDPKSLPSPKIDVMREYRINTTSSIENVIQKKLQKPYPYLSKGYPKKGVLIVGVFDPAFQGFKKDFEVTQTYLEKLSNSIQASVQNSSFDKVILVDALAPFHADPENFVCFLLVHPTNAYLDSCKVIKSQFKIFNISKPISLPFHCLDFVVYAFCCGVRDSMFEIVQ